MWNLRACAVCLTTDLKLNDISDGQIRREFNLASGLKTAQCNGMPQYLCVYCTAYVKRFVKFREKCQLAYYTLKEILDQSQEINLHHLQALNKDLLGLKPTLSFMDPKNCSQEEVMFQWVKYNRLNVSQKINIPIVLSSTIEDNMKFTAKENQNNVNKELVFEVPPIDTECIKEESNDLISDNYFDVSSKDKSQTDAFVEQSNVDDTENYFDNYISDNEFDNTEEKKEDRADGSNLEEEYANMIPISMNEAKAVSEVYKLFSNGKFRCQHCNKGYTSKNRLDVHLRMHDKHVSGSYLCELCNYYYKTEFLLKTHMTEKHMYKYLCRKCSEVSYDRVSAKQHFIWSHLQKGKKKNANWYETRPSWLNSKGGKRVKGIVSLKPVRKINKLPDDFPLYSPVSQEEQYLLINERKKTTNYLDSQYKCELCYRGFREMDTYNKHMRKHDPAVSGPVQCDMCKLQFRDARRIYKHMNITHLFKYTCQQCGYVCYNKGQARLHYRWHNNVTYPCPHCKREFKKMSTRLTHIRIKHPSNFICNICGHSFVSENGLYCHKNLTHTKEEIECSAALSAEAVAEAGAEADPLYCGECRVRFSCELAFDTHLGSSNKHAETNLSTKPRKSVTSLDAQRRRPGRGRPRRLRGASEVLNNGVATSSNCELCGKHLSNDVQARRHYQSTHPGAEFPKRYMCDVCGHTTKQYANLMVHMRTHTREKPYSCPHCDRRFSMPSNRDRHLVVHTGEKRYQCQHCNRRFTQSSAVKLHIQTVHLKIPYAPWDKKNRKRRRDQDAPVAPLPPDASAPFPLQPKLVFDSTVDYLNAFITYNDD